MAENASGKLAKAKEKIIVALDVSSEVEALELVSELKDYTGCFKVGLEYLTSAGIGIVQKILKIGSKIFYDGKFKDIPNTVAGASRAVARLGVNMFTVHATGGLEMMKQAAEAARSESKKLDVKSPMVLAVTVLTSINLDILNNELHIPGDLKSHVIQLAKLAEQAGLDGIIASPNELGVLRNNLPDKMAIITPGIRPVWASLQQDQKRVMTPSEAISQGASALVIGRPITKPPPEIGGPLQAIKRITEEIANALPD